MTDDNNRIIQGGELELEEGSLDEVVTESPQTESATQTTSTANGFPEVDMSFLNKSVLIYLQNITNKDEGITIFDGKEEGEINVTSKLLAGYVGMLEMLGNAFFTMDELKYVESQGVYYLQANLKLSD